MLQDVKLNAMQLERIAMLELDFGLVESRLMLDLIWLEYSILELIEIIPMLKALLGLKICML